MSALAERRSPPLILPEDFVQSGPFTREEHDISFFSGTEQSFGGRYSKSGRRKMAETHWLPQFFQKGIAIAKKAKDQDSSFNFNPDDIQRRCAPFFFPAYRDRGAKWAARLQDPENFLTFEERIGLIDAIAHSFFPDADYAPLIQDSRNKRVGRREKSIDAQFEATPIFKECETELRYFMANPRPIYENMFYQFFSEEMHTKEGYAHSPTGLRNFIASRIFSGSEIGLAEQKTGAMLHFDPCLTFGEQEELVRSLTHAFTGT